MKVPTYILSVAAILLVVPSQASAECEALAAQLDRSPASPQLNDSPSQAYERADACLAAAAKRYAGSSADASFIATAVIGACSEELNHAAARSQMATVAAGVTSPPPDGFFIELPPCMSGENDCKPWEREWKSNAEPLAQGTVVGSGSAKEVQAAGMAVAKRVRLRLEERSRYWIIEARVCSSETFGN